MMANYDIMSFLEYYADRNSILSGGVRVPTNQWQNFYQDPQTLDVDNQSSGDYRFLAFDADGFGSSDASEVNDLRVELAATGEIIDITDSAVQADNLIICSLYVQAVGQNAHDPTTAQLVSRYIGVLSTASLTDSTITWTINPAIDKITAQVPTRRVTPGMVDKPRRGQQ